MKIKNTPQAVPEVFDVFAVLWVTAILMEMVDRWKFPYITLIIFVVTIAVVSLKEKRLAFLLYLIGTTSYFLIARFPEVPNHVNLIIFCNVLLIFGLLYSYICSQERKSFSIYFDAMLSPLRLMLITMYFVAGFHKFNYDFINPDVSCIPGFLTRFERTLFAPMFTKYIDVSVPAFIFLGIFIAAAIYLVIRHGTTLVVRWFVLLSIIIILVLAFASSWDVVSAQGTTFTLEQMRYVSVAMAGLIVFLQLVEGPLLLVPRAQAIVLCFVMLFHTYLSLIGLVHFQSIALALILTFVPKEILEAWQGDRFVHVGTLRIDRIHAYFMLCAFAGILTGIQYHAVPVFANRYSMYAMQGVFYNLGVLVLLWPLLASMVAGNRQWRWRGVKVFNGETPGFLYFFPLLLLLWGGTSHLGLRTAGNLSMYSNLQTEGETSNHILFRNNPIKLWGYQEDTVSIIEIDDTAARVGYQYPLLQGNKLPVVEFRKLIDKWAKAGMSVPIVFEYRGQTYNTENIAVDPGWRVQEWDWEMKLMDFRTIQPEGPNRCRW
jgi:hypothetical protein